MLACRSTTTLKRMPVLRSSGKLVPADVPSTGDEGRVQGAARSTPKRGKRQRPGVYPRSYLAGAMKGGRESIAELPLQLIRLRHLLTSEGKACCARPHGVAIDEPTDAERAQVRPGSWGGPDAADGSADYWQPMVRTLNRLVIALRPASRAVFAPLSQPSSLPWYDMLVTQGPMLGENNDCMWLSRRQVSKQPHLCMDRRGGYVWVTLMSYKGLGFRV